MVAAGATKPQAYLGHSGFNLCGAPLCTGPLPETEFHVMRIPRCDMPRCGQCTASDHDVAEVAELSLVHDAVPLGPALQRNMRMAKVVVREVFSEIEVQCAEERLHYEEAGITPPRHKMNTWLAYTNKARLQRYTADSLDFVQHNADCRTRALTPPQLRFLVLLQHFVSEDTDDLYRPENQRKHQDCFEGVLTDGVNSQLVKDAHRSEFSVEGRCFSLEDLPQDADGAMDEERRREIAKFQTEFVIALESYLLAFCQRNGFSTQGTKRMVQAVTTQMSQAGLANLDRGSQAARYFVGSVGLDQRTAYNLSTMYTPDHGESLKLSILCMKTGFSQYLVKDDLLKMSGVDYPKSCMPSSYLYQYATLRFMQGPMIDNCETVVCTLIDALDEAHIDPVRK